MPITSNALFHYTAWLKHPSGILAEKFKMTYCKESYLLNGRNQENYYPMVSFCDIPLSEEKNYIASNGSYGIGMSKEWGIKHRLNPVQYIDQNSFLAADLIATYDKMVTIVRTFLKVKNGTVEIGSDSLTNLIKEMATDARQPETLPANNR